MDCVKIPKIGSIPVFIGLSLVGIYPNNWGKDSRKEKPQGYWDD
jgi:hypothetical protein